MSFVFYLSNRLFHLWETCENIFDSSLRDTAVIKKTCKKLKWWLQDLKKWTFQESSRHGFTSTGFLPMILWRLLLSEFPISTISDLERKVSHSLRRWLSLPRSFSSIALYGNTCKLRSPKNSLRRCWRFCIEGRCSSSKSSVTPKFLGQGWQSRPAGSWEQKLHWSRQNHDYAMKSWWQQWPGKGKGL